MPDLLLTVSAALESGIFPDLKGRSSPMWIDGANVYFNDGGIQAGLGEYMLFSQTDFNEVLGVCAVKIQGTQTIFYGTKTKLYMWTVAGGLTDVTRVDGGMALVPYTGTINDLWSIIPWGDWIYATNGVDTPQLFKATRFANATGLGAVTKAKVVAERSPFAVLFNTNVFDKDVNFCADDNIENFVAASDNLAGRLTARGLESGITCAKKLGTELVFYGSNELRKLSFIGSPLAFGILPGVRGIGAVGLSAVTDVSGIHYGLGPRGFWRTDSNSSEVLSQGLIHKYLYESINKSAWQKTVTIHDQAQSMVIAFYPSGTSTTNDKGVGYNYKNKSWTLFNYGYSAGHDSGAFDYAIMGDNQGGIWAFGVAGTPPTVGSTNEISVSQASAEILSGYGDLGYGEGGYGGILDTDG